MLKFFAAIVLLATATTTGFAQDKPVDSQKRFQVAESDLCAKLRANYKTCEANWKSVGGGSTGQAGSFKDCMQVYYNAGVASGCWK